MNITANHKNTLDKNCSSSNCGVPLGAANDNFVLNYYLNYFLIIIAIYTYSDMPCDQAKGFAE